MFLPPPLRLIMVAIYAFITWKFLSLGMIVIGAGMMATVEGRADALPLVPIGSMLLFVGLMALYRLKSVLGRSGTGF